jgi:hypothetical protein
MAEKDTKTSDEKLDAIATHLDSLHKRMDGWDNERKADKAKYDAACAKMDAAEEEKRKADAAKADAAEKEEKEKADKARADAEDKEKEEKEKADAKAKADADEKEKADKVKADAAASSNADVRKMIADMEKRLPANMTGADVIKFTEAKRRAERVYQAFGDSAGADRWANGETYDSYRRRLLGGVKQHSAQWKEVDLTAFEGKALDTVEVQVYADSYQTATSPASVPVGTLRKHVDVDATGRQITSFTGDPEACWGQFKAPKQVMTGMDMHKKLN